MASGVQDTLDALLAEARGCRLCEQELPLGPRPVLRASATARMLIVGQAPGLLVHQTGIPWNDPSGDRLRDWMGIDRDVFYDESRIAIIPTGLCYPGRDARGGDLPPRNECARLWHPRLTACLPNVRLRILAGRYAHRLYLGKRVKSTLTETVRAWEEYLPEDLVLPHPSFRNLGWLQRNPWFEERVIPELRRRVLSLLEPV